MPHVIEPAASGRAKCRGCGERIAAGELRFGERIPNPFADGETTLWFHPRCAAFKRPEPLLEALDSAAEAPPDAERLGAEARRSAEHRRLPRIDGAQRSPSGRARCRSCRETIAKGDWRISLVYYDEGRFEPSGYIHARCAAGYFSTADVLDRVRHFTPTLTDGDAAELRTELAPPDAGGEG